MIGCAKAIAEMHIAAERESRFFIGLGYGR